MAKSLKKLICGRCHKPFIENMSDYYCDDCYYYVSEEGNRG